MTELKLQNKVTTYLKKTYPGAFIWKISDKWYSGIPDIFMLNKGTAYFIELKVKGNKPTKLQEHTLNQLWMAGAVTGVAYSLDDVKKILKEVN